MLNAADPKPGKNMRDYLPVPGWACFLIGVGFLAFISLSLYTVLVLTR